MHIAAQVYLLLTPALANLCASTPADIQLMPSHRIVDSANEG